MILAPQGRDAVVAAAMLGEAGLDSHACPSVEAFVAEIAAGAGFGVITEEALRTANLHPLVDLIGSQPEWSDFPFILLTLRGGGLERNPSAARHLDTLGNVTFLERPFHPTTLISLAHSARRARRRQYEARSRLEELHALAIDLEQRVEQRTQERQAAIAQLHEVQKLETLGQLTGGVAHDFNNLLTPIVAALDLLQRRLTGQDARIDRWIANALQSAERARTLVQRLLGFARRQELSSRPVDITALVGGMRDLIASSVGPTIELRLDCRPELPQALADPNQLELAILNLCVNARDAMPGGGILSVTAERVRIDADAAEIALAPGEYLRLAVVDTGEGMAPETLARAVEPFFSTKELGRGTGLGLSMVHGLTAQLGGAFVLSSVLGEGTRAEVYLPITEGQAEVPPGLAAEPAGALPPRHILVVDDEALVRNGTAEMLRSLGHTVAEAQGGVEALDLLFATPAIDAVVTDYMMPRMDGVELAERIQRRSPDMPVLLISGYTGAAHLVADLPRLSKPFGLNELAHALNRACHVQ